MPPDLLLFLNKLPKDQSTYKLEWQGLKIDKKYFELKTLLPNLSHPKLLALAILLQHLLLSTFTQEELLAVADLPLELLSVTNTPTAASKTLSNSRPLFDTDSSRVYDFINTANIADNSKLQLTAGYLDFNNSNLQEIITKLYTGGF